MEKKILFYVIDQGDYITTAMHDSYYHLTLEELDELNEIIKHDLEVRKQEWSEYNESSDNNQHISH